MTMTPMNTLVTYEKNARRGDIPVIAASLKELGQFRPITVNKGSKTGRPNEILAGNHTYLAAESLGWGEIDAHFIDVDDDFAKRVVLADNRTSDLGTYDDTELAALLASVPDLTGTGYTATDLDDLLVTLEAVNHAGTLTVSNPTDSDGTGMSPDSPSAWEPSNPWKKADRRIMVLDVSIPVFIWMQEHFALLAKEFAVNSNLAVIVKLMADRLGDEPPEIPQGDEDQNLVMATVPAPSPESGEDPGGYADEEDA